MNKYCIILAGGKGRRLWPYSRESEPKQFIDFFGTGKTQLQSTFSRFSSFLPKDNIIVCTTRGYESKVRAQLPDLPPRNLIVESLSRNTAPSVALACIDILLRDRDATIIVSPSDQYVADESSFAADISHGLDLVAERDIFIVVGIRPTRPEPGYGYIQMGDCYDSDNVFKVKSFTEKPEREFARMFMDNQEFYWNTSLFIGSARLFHDTFKGVFSEMRARFLDDNPTVTLATEASFFASNFSMAPNISIDHAILDHCDNVYLMRSSFGWADIGTWHSMFECLKRSDDDNVLVDTEALLDNCHGNVIKLESGRLAVVSGLDNFIVTEKDGVLLICRKGDSSSLVKKLANEVQMKYGDKFM